MQASHNRISTLALYRSIFLLTFGIPLFSAAQFSRNEIDRFKMEAQAATIIQDTWGVPHIYGKSDADAVFGLMYVECEENFPQVERNYLEMMGRLSESEGKNQLYQDLEMRLIYDSSAAIRDYKNAPGWFKKLLDAFADGVNYYLYKHPDVKPKLLGRFEAWFPLMYTDGSISPTETGGLTMRDMQALYHVDQPEGTAFTDRRLFTGEQEPGGSNGLAVGPSKTASGNSILYINPHVTFYFRMEAQMTSEQGLNVYGAVTWGQFFIYQGFNEHCGWMHTSSYADVADLYEEKTTAKNDSLYYQYDDSLFPIKQKNITIAYRQGDILKQQFFTTYATLHGPVMGMRNGKWLSLREHNRSLEALMQSWMRTKAKGFDEFKSVMEMRSNNSNNTVFADDKGHIAYWHGNFMPKRNPQFDWSQPVDGSISATAWQGIHSLNEMIHVYDPASGWIENSNSTPFTVSGISSPKKEDYPIYMAPDGQNPRAINAIRLLSKAHDLTIDKMISDIGYSHYLSAFEILLPPLFSVYDALPANDPLKNYLAEPISALRSWDMNSSDTSIASTLAIEWAYKLLPKATPAKTPEQSSDIMRQINSMVTNTTPAEKISLFAETLKELEKRFGNWKTAWGLVNRYQRIGRDESFDASKPSLPVGLAAATWGSLPSFATRRLPATNKRYGVSGNSFIACVEFGKKIKAKSVVTGGQSFNPGSKHFTDQAPLYIEGKLKDVWFYKEDVLKHVERSYHPGE